MSWLGSAARLRQARRSLHPFNAQRYTFFCRYARKIVFLVRFCLENAFHGLYFDHWTTRNCTETRIYILPLITLICTDIPGIRVNPCASVVGNISRWETSFCGYILTTEPHGTALKQEYIFSHWLHWYALISRVFVSIRARRWLVISPAERHPSVVMF